MVTYSPVTVSSFKRPDESRHLLPSIAILLASYYFHLSHADNQHQFNEILFDFFNGCIDSNLRSPF